jgi:GDP-L-fucose synthase
MMHSEKLNSKRTVFEAGLPKTARIFVAGHRGMVGSAITRTLKNAGYRNLVTRSRSQLDLTDQKAVESIFQAEEIDAVFMAAALVGGIQANNTYPADFIYQNLIIECNVLNSAFQHKVSRLLFLGSSCIYPRETVQPMREEQLLSGYLEPTNEPYAVAKIAGIKLCEAYNRQYGTDFRAVMPTNLYGPNDNFDLNDSHVLPALVRRFHLARLARKADWKAVEADINRFGAIPDDEYDRLKSLRGERVLLWGTGGAKREFLHVDDLAAACLHVMQLSREDYFELRSQPASDSMDRQAKAISHINVGYGSDISIKNLAEMVSGIVGYTGDIQWDSSRPDGMPRKLLNIDRIQSAGWHPTIELPEGIHQTYRWYRDQT